MLFWDLPEEKNALALLSWLHVFLGNFSGCPGLGRWLKSTNICCNYVPNPELNAIRNKREDDSINPAFKELKT